MKLMLLKRREEEAHWASTTCCSRFFNRNVICIVELGLWDGGKNVLLC